MLALHLVPSSGFDQIRRCESVSPYLVITKDQKSDLSQTILPPARLKTWSGEGQIRLSEDEGPSAQSFVVNDEHDREDDDVVTPPQPSPLRSPQPNQQPNLARDREAL